MQTFSGMQRNSAYQTAFIGLAYLLVYAVYVGLSSIYLFLPPLFGILFLYFMRALEKERMEFLLLVALMLVLYEVEKGYLLFSSLVFFGLMYRFIVPKLRQYIDCRWCLNLIYVSGAYLGFWLFSVVMSKIFWLEMPAIDWHVILYIVLEFLMAAIL